jgi:ribose 5-phosphate isomerase B
MSDPSRRGHAETLALGESPARYRTLVLSNDHAGVALRGVARQVMSAMCRELVDLGTNDEAPVDFPDVTAAAVRMILRGEAERAVLVCGTGAGACIAANKVPGIRAAVCHDTYVARQAVVHDDVNVLCIGAWIVGPQIAAQAIWAFLDAVHSTEPHFRRRVAKLTELERLTPDSALEDLARSVRAPESGR